jgi:hypothetical protein
MGVIAVLQLEKITCAAALRLARVLIAAGGNDGVFVACAETS